jgi:hypothetical protein
MKSLILALALLLFAPAVRADVLDAQQGDQVIVYRKHAFLACFCTDGGQFSPRLVGVLWIDPERVDYWHEAGFRLTPGASRAYTAWLKKHPQLEIDHDAGAVVFSIQYPVR